MNNDRAQNPPISNQEELQELVRRLAEAEIDFQAAITGQVDAVVDPVTRAPVMLRQAQEALLQREQLLSQAEAIAHLGSWIFDLRSGSVTCSEELLRIFGMPAQTAPLTLEAFFEPVHPHDREKVETKFESALLDPKAFSLQYRVQRPDGSVRFLETRAEITLGPQGEPLELIGTAQDVTEQKIAEEELLSTLEELREAEEQLRAQNEALTEAQTELQHERKRYRDLFEFAPDGYLVTDGNGTIQEANRAAGELLGVRPDLLVGEPLVVFISTTERVYFHSMLGQVNRGEKVRGWETSLQPRHGNSLPMTLIVAANRDGQGRVQALRWLVHDIRERVRAEKTLRESEERYRLVVESVKDYAIFTLDPEGKVTSWNSGACAINGYTEEEVLGKNFSCFYPPGAEELAREALETASAQGRYSTEGWRVRKDGSLFWATVVISAMHDKQGRLRGFSKVVRDITRRKQAAEALQKQTTYVRLLQEVSAAANQATSVESALQTALERICLHFGWEVGRAYIPSGTTPTELVSANTWYLSDPGRLTPFQQASREERFLPGEGLPGQVFASGKPVWIFDVTQYPEYRRGESARSSGLKMGAAFPIMAREEVAGVLEFYASQPQQPDEVLLEVMAHVGTQLGRVFERAQAEAELRKSEARFRTVFNGSALGIELLDLDGRLLECNPALSQMLGYTYNELQNMRLMDFSHFANDSEERPLFQALRAGERESYRLEKQLFRKDGAPLWVHLLVSLVRDKDGQPQYIIGMLEDVTNRKQLEAELLELNRRMVIGREKDRAHLSRELHDGPVQDLYGLSFHFKAFTDNLPAGVDRKPVESLQSSLHGVINTLRTICSELRPPTLAPFGLEKAIRSHAASFQEAHPELAVQLNLMADSQDLPEPVRLALFRIYQQAMVNVVRHAQARNLLIHFALDENQITLAIQDDGVGFSLPERWIKLARDGHLGLAGAAERAKSVGGELKIETAPGKGTLLRVVVPRSNSDQPVAATEARNQPSHSGNNHS